MSHCHVQDSFTEHEVMDSNLWTHTRSPHTLCWMGGIVLVLFAVQVWSTDRLMSWSARSSYWQDQSNASYQGLHVSILRTLWCHWLIGSVFCTVHISVNFLLNVDTLSGAHHTKPLMSWHGIVVYTTLSA